MMRFLLSAVLLAFLWCLAQAAEPTYSVVIDRENTVGEKYHISVNAAERATIKATAAGKVVDNYDAGGVSICIEGTVQILAVNAQKHPIKKSLTIDKFTQTDGDQETTLADKGTVVMCTVTNVYDDVEYTINGKAVNDDQKEALDLSAIMTTDDISDDEVFGAKEPRHIGDSWDINSISAAQWMTEEGMSVASKDVSGKTTLCALVMADGQPCLRIESQMQLKNLDAIDLPSELTSKGVTSTLTISGLFPVNTNLQPIETQQSFTTQTQAEGNLDDKNGPKMNYTMTITSTVKTKYRAAAE